MPSHSDNVIYDLAVIGGGIAGTAVLRETAARGVKTILFEKNTLGSGTSSKSSKLIHGGLRYLETAWNDLLRGHFFSAWKNFHFVCASLSESKILSRTAPRLIEPLPILIPIYKNKGQNFWLISAGAVLYGLLGVLFGSSKFPSILSSARAVLSVESHLEPRDLRGGIIIWDHTTDDYALVRAVAAAALRDGGAYLEHCRVLSWKPIEDMFIIQTEQDGNPQTYYAKTVIVAAGPWTDTLRRSRQEPGSDFILPIAGAHLNTRKFIDHSVLLQAQDQRVFFVINRGDHARIGTTERLHQNPDHLPVTEEERQYLLSEVNRYFPDIRLTSQDILSEDAGIRPLARPEDERKAHFASREHEIRKSEDGTYWLLGVKLTDHRRAAKQTAVRLIQDHFPEKSYAVRKDYTKHVSF